MLLATMLSLDVLFLLDAQIKGTTVGVEKSTHQVQLRTTRIMTLQVMPVHSMESTIRQLPSLQYGESILILTLKMANHGK